MPHAAAPLGAMWSSVLHYAPGALVPAAFGFLNSVVFTRLFDAGGYGRFSLVVSIASLAAAVLSQWLQQGVGRYLPGETSPDAVAALKGATGQAIALILLTCGALAVVARPRVLSAVGEAWDSMYWPACAFVVTTAVTAPLTTILQAEMRAKRHTAYNVVGVVSRFCASIGLVLLYRRDPSSLVISGAVTQAVLVLPLWRDAGAHLSLPWGPRAREALDALGRVARYGMPMVGYFVAASLLAVGDRYVIQYFRGDAEVGIYSANYTIISFGIGLVTGPISLAAHPFLMRAWGSKTSGEAARALATITETYLIAGALLVGATFVFSEDAARLVLGPSFREGHRIMPVVLAGVVAWQAAMYTHKPLEFTNRSGRIFALSIAAAALNVTANIWLIPIYGYVAAAYTTLGSYLAYAVATAALGQRVVRWTMRWRSLGEVLIVTTTAMAAAAWLKARVASTASYPLGLAVAAAVVAVTTLLVGRRYLVPLLRSAAAP